MRLIATPASARLRLVFLLAFAALVCGRMPGIILHGRVWAEEGLFYQNAWTMPAGRALLVEYGGYLNLAANAAALLARHLLPLAEAPWILTGVGLMFQLCPALLIVTAQARWLQSAVAMAGSLFVLAAAPIAEEVFLQSLHSQYHLALCVALILSFDDRPGLAVRWLRRALLLLAPLCGILAVLLLPLFAARALMDRTRERTLQCGSLLVGTLLQIGLFYSPASSAAIGRSTTIWPGVILDSITLRHIILPLFGTEFAQVVGHRIRAGLTDRWTSLWPALTLAIVLSGVFWLSMRRFRSGAPWLLASGVGLALVSYYGAIDGGANFLDPGFGQRYSFVPEVLFAWTLICVAASSPGTWGSDAAGGVAGWICVVSAILLYDSPRSRFAAGPNWRVEVARWEADPSRLIRLWPEGWTMQLNPDHTPAPLASRTGP